MDMQQGREGGYRENLRFVPSYSRIILIEWKVISPGLSMVYAMVAIHKKRKWEETVERPI